MNKQDIIQQLAASEDLPENEVEAVVDELLHLVEQRMKKGEETQIYGFGKFGVRWWRGRTGRDPQTGEEIEIDGRWMPYWSPSPTLIEEEPPEEAAATKPANKPKKAAGAAVKKAAGESAGAEQKPPQQQNGQSGATEKKASPSEQPETPEVPEPETQAPPAEAAPQEQPQDKEQPREAEQPSEPEPPAEPPEQSVPEEAEELPKEQASRHPEPAGDRTEALKSQSGKETESPPDQGDEESSPFLEHTEDVRPIGAGEPEPDWQDIGDEISMKELRFISRQLEEEPEESAAGLFFFDEGEAGASEPEDSEEQEVREVPDREEKITAEDREPVPLFSEEEEEVVTGEPVQQEPELREEPEELEWAIMERKRGKLGWVTILLLSFALVAFGAYTLLQDHLPQFPSFLSQRENPVEPQPTEPTPSANAGNTTAEDQPAAQPPDQAAGSPSETASAGAVAPYDFGRARRANFLVIYTSALDSFQADRYQSAQQVLERLLVSNPPGDYVDNIHYWLGECQFAQARYTQAVREFEEVFESPTTNKAEDALIMMAKAYLQLNDMNQARDILIKFRTQYPNSQYTDLANQWLQEYNLLAAGQSGTE